MAPNKIVASERREQIVQATIRCLARDGYACLTMKTLAREAGVSQGILHYYFEDKAAMLVAALEAVTTELDRRLTLAQRGHAQEPYRRLHAVIRACLDTALERPEVWRVYIQLWGEMRHNERLYAINADLYARMRRQVAALLTLGMRRGTFREINVNHAAAVIVGLIDGVALQLSFDPQALPLTTAVQCCYEAIERYLRLV
ncbi:HTH-type transcriptional regulator BetI [Candidatus Entotheonellaceae bacterium PAL068K]